MTRSDLLFLFHWTIMSQVFQRERDLACAVAPIFFVLSYADPFYAALSLSSPLLWQLASREFAQENMRV